MQETTTESSEIKRLHITPFDPSILPSVLPASIRPLASEISFHSIATFPENSYGYVSLPAMEADKIKKKLNGSILKGKKFKVEAARPSKRRRDEDDDEAAEPTPKSDKKSDKKADKKSKKRKATENVVEGYELPADRHVKRSWTESTGAKEKRRTEEKRKKEKGEKKAKLQAKSKYSEKSECLFQAKLPPNRVSNGEKKDKSSKKKKNKDPLQTTVHEFENTVTYPSFLRAAGEDVAPVSRFEEGKGWVDASDNVKEKPSERVRTKDHKPGQLPGAKEKRPSLKRAQAKVKKNKASKESTSESEDWTSSDASSDDSSSDSEDDDDSVSSSASETSKTSTAGNKHPTAQSNPTEAEADSSSSESDSETSVKSDERPAETTNEPSASDVHPLEALFKRPAPKTAEKAPEPEPTAQFSFFGQGDDIDSDEEMKEPAATAEASEAPQTPFTKRDLQSRGLRSAAPTPDTALVNRNIKWDSEEEDDSATEAGVVNTPLRKFGAAENAESDFAKWFWENRGDNNRAWKKRRRDAAKEQRQRENRSKGMKGRS
ncbi:hypothetical protein P168DRAFT_301960 [Aspergillus campestris IBT 28561]|uniref:Suppressor protein SRP40 n=1 Tax=Aspergillus campestris (strain IBT 28561) TaxID=1392248 RepID=A0A2I1DAP3_ASPC2|nr:uncharacterized protein P168DRAFT_301960 [Aspergillus campestris IBT 28561]PKY06939.1 hypothetical protein P168DRAFT_301960 [Aspergillus campestris IBT 28561]